MAVPTFELAPNPTGKSSAAGGLLHLLMLPLVQDLADPIWDLPIMRVLQVAGFDSLANCMLIKHHSDSREFVGVNSINTYLELNELTCGT